MKFNKIQSAYIKNKPTYNYEIVDEDNILVAKGHLLSARLRALLDKYRKTTIDEDGNIQTNVVLNALDYCVDTLTLSLTWWILDIPINKLSILNMDLQVTIWLLYKILLINNKSLLLVDANSKN